MIVVYLQFNIEFPKVTKTQSYSEVDESEILNNFQKNIVVMSCLYSGFCFKRYFY